MVLCQWLYEYKRFTLCIHREIRTDPEKFTTKKLLVTAESKHLQLRFNIESQSGIKINILHTMLCSVNESRLKKTSVNNH